MRLCKKCGTLLPNRVKINGKFHVIRNRKFCLDCSPFGKHNTKDLSQESTDLKIRRKKQSSYIKKRRQEFKLRAIEYLGGKCQVCGYDKNSYAFDFHHKDPKEKDFSISNKSYNFSWERVEQELKKCVLLCANCHREVHSADY